MRYENVISPDQINDLNVTKRDILGRNYQRSDEESSLGEQIGVVRQKQQDDAAVKALKDEAAAATAKKHVY